jgi:hypothetical protein
MPIKAIDYSNTVIYKIVCNDFNIKDTYVGHTTSFRRRKNEHKSDCHNKNTNNYHYKVYQTIREHGNWINWSMIEIEKFPCKDGNEARARERYWYEELKATLNMDIPNRTIEEWKKDNDEKIKEKRKTHYQEHAKEINKKCQEYNIEHREEIREYFKIYNATEDRKEYMKTWNKEHREELNQKKREQYAKRILNDEDRKEINRKARERYASHSNKTG